MRKAKKEHERELAKLREEQKAQLSAQKSELSGSVATLEAELKAVKKGSEEKCLQKDLAHQSEIIEQVRAHNKPQLKRGGKG